MRGRIPIILLSLSLSTQGLAASQADQERCAAYALKAVQQYQLLQAHPQCLTKIDPFAWNGDYEYHHKGCLLLPAFLSKHADEVRDEHLRTCGALDNSDPAAVGNTATPAEAAPTLAPTSPPGPTPSSAPASAPGQNPAATPGAPPTSGPASAPTAGLTPAPGRASAPGANRPTLPASYTLIDLATASGKNIQAYGLNDAGTVVGSATFAAFQQVRAHALLFDGTLHEIGGPSPDAPDIAEAVNASGQVTGRAHGNVPYFYDGVMHLLPKPDPGAGGEGTGINSSGKIVGNYFAAYNIPGEFTVVRVSRGFFYDGKFHDLGGPPGRYTYAVAINDADQIAGYGQISSLQLHAFIYDGKLHDLGTLAPGGMSKAAGIDKRGRVVGTASDAAGNPHAFLYDGTLHDLGTLDGKTSEALAINAAGIIVGRAEVQDEDYHTHAFVSNGGALIDLNHRLSGSHDGINLTEAIAINASGTILAHSEKSKHYYLLTPSSVAATEPAPPPCVEPAGPPQGSGAKIDRSSAETTTLSFRSLCGSEHHFAVTRPKFAAPMLANSDTGGWVYAAPDKQSGIMFNVTAHGDVTANPLGAPQLHMMIGP